MGKIVKAVVFGGKARVAVIDTTKEVNASIKMHDLSPLAAAILGRSLTIGAYVLSGFKNEKDRFNLIIGGGGAAGKVYVAGSGNSIKGFIENPAVDLPIKNGKLDVGGAIGADGDLTLVKDLGLKEPYVGKTPLVNGEIAEDFAGYLLNSEGINNAVALGVLTDKNGCRASGGVIVEALPSVNDFEVVILEDIISNLGSFSALLAEKSVEEIADFYFSHLDSEIFPASEFYLNCDCEHKVQSVVNSLGKGEAEAIIKEQGKIELHCDYCSKYYTYSQDDVEKIFGLNG